MRWDVASDPWVFVDRPGASNILPPLVDNEFNTVERSQNQIHPAVEKPVRTFGNFFGFGRRSEFQLLQLQC